VPATDGAVFDRRSQVDILVRALAGVGNAVEVEGAGSAYSRIAITRQDAKLSCRSEGVTQIRACGVVVKFIYLDGVVALKSVEATVV
jgi:hypothetical protein